MEDEKKEMVWNLLQCIYNVGSLIIDGCDCGFIADTEGDDGGD